MTEGDAVPPGGPPSAPSGGPAPVPPGPPAWYVAPPGAPPGGPRWRTPLPVPAAPPRYGIGDVLVGLVVWFVVELVVGFLAVTIGRDRGVAVIVAQLAGLAVLGGWPVLVSRRKGSGSIRDDFGWRFRLPLDLGLGVLAAFGVIFASGILRAVLAALTRSEVSTNATAIYGDQQTSVGVAVMVVLAALGAPLAEELFFRGLALRAFEKRTGAVWAAVLSTALFAVLHVFGASGSLVSRLVLVAGIAVYGAAFSALTLVTGRLGPAVLGHVSINTLATIVYFTLANTPA